MSHDAWERIDQHASVLGRFTISHALVRGVHRFTLWEGNEIRGVFGDVKRAKHAADIIDRMRETAMGEQGDKACSALTR